MTDSFDTHSSPFLPATRAEIARHFGEPMAEVVSGAVARALRDVAARAEEAGVSQETAVAGFLHVCREFCGSMQGREAGGDRMN